LRTYEGMFLFDPTSAADWSNVEAEIARLMKRAGAKLLVSKKWDERRLAYEIKGRNRGCYVLTYFQASPEKISGIERDVHLSDHVLRCLVLRADHVTEEKMSEPTPAEAGPRSVEGEDHDSAEPAGRERRRSEPRHRAGPNDASGPEETQKAEAAAKTTE